MNHLPFSILLITTLLLFTSTVQVYSAPSPSPYYGCDRRCDNRCSRARYKEECLRLCEICCNKCQGCVPSGPYGDKAECPCYRDMKNPKGKDKCP